MKTGAVQALPLRQLITPDPYSPPNTNAAFFIDGITITHSALRQKSSGIPLSGVPLSSVRIAPDSSSRFTSSFESAANAVDATSKAPQVATTFFTMSSSPHVPTESPRAIALQYRCQQQTFRFAEAATAVDNQNAA